MIRKTVTIGYKEDRNVKLNQVLEGILLFCCGQIFQVPALGIADNLYALMGKELNEASQRQAGAVEIRLGDVALVDVLIVHKSIEFYINAFAKAINDIRNAYLFFFGNTLMLAEGHRSDGLSLMKGYIFIFF